MADSQHLVKVNFHSSECTVIQCKDKLYRITRIRSSEHGQAPPNGWHDQFIHLPDNVDAQDTLDLIRTLNPWIYGGTSSLPPSRDPLYFSADLNTPAGFAHDVTLTALVSPLHQYRFNALALTRKVPCLKEFETEVIEAIQRSASVLGLSWINLGLKYQAVPWLIQGCMTFLSAPPLWRTMTTCAENNLTPDTLVKLYRIKELFEFPMESEDNAPLCLHCRRLVLLSTSDTGVPTWLRTCPCYRSQCFIGLKPQEHMEEVLGEIAEDIFSEKYTRLADKDAGDAAMGKVDGSQIRKRRKILY